MNEPPRQIAPETVAAKMDAARNFTTPAFARQLLATPRVEEALWHLQAISLRPGGLPKFSEDLLAAYSERIGTKAFFAIGDKEGDYTASEQKQIGERVPERFCHYTRRQCPPEPNTEWPFDFAAAPAAFRQFCQDKAKEQLPQFLEGLFVTQDYDISAPWYFPRFLETLFEFMDGHAATASERLACTAVVKQVFDALDYAADEKAMVQIFGDSRFGKTEAVKTWAEMRPGIGRLVQVPFSSSLPDLFRAIAEALGIPFTHKTNPRELKEKIEFVARVSPLMLIFDEAHFLVPVTYTADTPPMRLNWLRTLLVDRRTPVVLVSTPQDFKRQTAKFVSKTQYNFAQFAGRNMLTVNLPAELSQADLLAVAQIHFPELEPDHLQLIAAKAMQSESYLQAVEAIARRARWLAKRDGRPAVALSDLTAAIAEITGGAMAAPAPKVGTDRGAVRPAMLTAPLTAPPCEAHPLETAVK